MSNIGLREKHDKDDENRKRPEYVAPYRLGKLPRKRMTCSPAHSYPRQPSVHLYSQDSKDETPLMLLRFRVGETS